MVQTASKSFIGYLNWKSGDICLFLRCYREREEIAQYTVHGIMRKNKNENNKTP